MTSHKGGYVLFRRTRSQRQAGFWEPRATASQILEQLRNLFRRGQLPLQVLRQSLGDLVRRHTDGLAGVVQRVLHDRTALFLAENDADGGVLAVFAYLSIQRRQVELHLPDKLWLKLSDFELDGHQTAQTAVEQQQVDEVFPAIHLQTELATHKGEQAAHGPQKILDAGDQCPFQLALAVLFSQLQKIG